MMEAHLRIADGPEVRRIQTWSRQVCRAPVEPTPPHAKMQRTQQLDLMEENYTPAPPHLQLSYAALDSQF